MPLTIHPRDAGRELLRRFIERNILIFQQTAVAERIQRILDTGGAHEG